MISKHIPGAIMDLDIKGLRVLVTAGANGFGLAIARAFTRGRQGSHLRCR
jgi:NAD(P)-dependent dehydrogenase (short-subunit alcohol dehydrogenase family)